MILILLQQQLLNQLWSLCISISGCRKDTLLMIPDWSSSWGVQFIRGYPQTHKNNKHERATGIRLLHLFWFIVGKKTQTDSPTNIVLVIQSRRGLEWGWWRWQWDCSNKQQTNCILCLLCFYKNLLLKHHQCSRHEFTRPRITTPATARRTSFIYKADEWAEGGVWGVQDAIQRNAAVNESKSYCHCDCVFYSAILKWWRKKNWRRRRRKRKLNDSSRILQWLIIIWALCQGRRKAEGGGQARDRLALAFPLHATHRSSSSDHCVCPDDDPQGVIS